MHTARDHFIPPLSLKCGSRLSKIKINDTFLFSRSSLCQGAAAGLSGVGAGDGFSGAGVGAGAAAAGVGAGSGGVTLPSSS